MEKVYTLMKERYQVHLDRVDDMPFGIPEWKEMYNIRYKYYYNNDIEVKFDISNKKLTLTCYEHNFKEVYDIKYPRFTSKGIDDKSNYYYQFFFSVYDRNEEVVIIIRADNIRNYHELCTSNLFVQVTSSNNIFTRKKILKYQEFIYHDLGLGLGLREISIGEKDLSKIDMTRDEFDYGIYSLMFRVQKEYLCDKVEKLGIEKHEILELIDSCDKATCLMGKRVKSIGLTKDCFMEIRYLMEINYQLDLRKKVIKEKLINEGIGVGKLNKKLLQISKRLENLIYLNKISSLLNGRNVLQTLRVYGMDINNINIQQLTQYFLEDIDTTKLSVMEMLEMVFNHKRTIKEAFRVEEYKKEIVMGLAII